MYLNSMKLFSLDVWQNDILCFQKMMARHMRVGFALKYHLLCKSGDSMLGTMIENFKRRSGQWQKGP